MVNKIQRNKLYRDPEWVETFVKQYLISPSLNLCCGLSNLGDIRVDIDPLVKPDIIADMWNLPFKRSSFNSIYCDPIWDDFKMNIKQRFVYSLFELLKGGGLLIWNCNWAYDRLGKNTEVIDAMYHHNRMHGKLSVIMVYKRPYAQLEQFVEG